MIYLGEKVHDENDDTAFIISILPNDQPLTSPPTSPNLSSSSEVIQDTSKVLFMTREVRSNIVQSKWFPNMESVNLFTQKALFYADPITLVFYVLTNIIIPGSYSYDRAKLLQWKRNVVLYFAKARRY